MEQFLDGRLTRFMLTKPSTVQERVALLAAQEAAKVLHIPCPEIKFFYRSNGETLRGLATDEGVYIAADMPDTDTVSTVLHEMRHVWQRRNPGCRTWSEDRRERDARLFELSWPR